MNLERLGDDCINLIKRSVWFPYQTGNLKFHATKGNMLNSNTYIITFDSKIAPYVEALEEGSNKHKGFISDKSVNAIINYIKIKYNGEVR